MIEQPPLPRRLRQVEPCHMEMTEMRAASSLPEHRQSLRAGLDVQVLLGALTLPPCVPATACLRVVGPELLALRLLFLVLAHRSALVVTKLAAWTRPRQALAGQRLMGERVLLHRIRCIACLAEVQHIGNRAWATWRFAESVIATARAPAGAHTILPLPQGARVERDVHRGADMDRRAILELHGHRRAILVVTDGRANLLQVGLADHLQRALAAVGEGPNPKQTQLRRRGALVGVAQGDGRQLRVAEASRVEGEHHREPPLATFELFKRRHPAAAGVLVHNVGERLVELQEGHTPVLPGLHPQRILKLPHDGLQDVARGPKARHLDAVAVAEDHLAHIMVVLFVVEVAPCVRDAKDLVQREVHLVVQEEAEVDAVVLLLNRSHDVVHLPNMHLVQLLDVK